MCDRKNRQVPSISLQNQTAPLLLRFSPSKINKKSTSPPYLLLSPSRFSPSTIHRLDSGGDRQRLSIRRNAILRPAVLVLDSTLLPFRATEAVSTAVVLGGGGSRAEGPTKAGAAPQAGRPPPQTATQRQRDISRGGAPTPHIPYPQLVDIYLIVYLCNTCLPAAPPRLALLL